MTSFLTRATVLAFLALPAALTAQQAEPWAALRRPATRTPTATTGDITVADLQTRASRFAADALQGRLMGKPGGVMAG